MLRYINYRMRITLQDSRVLVGTFMAFDRHMNIVLGETEEFRKIRAKKSSGSGLVEEREERRALGLIILRGDSVVSMTIEGPPPPDMDEKLMPGGPGVIKAAAARGLPIPGMNFGGIGGPVAGIGGPGMGIMQPASQVAAQMAPRPGMMPPMPPGMMPPGMPPRPPGMPGMLPPGMMPPMPPGMMPPGMPPRPGMMMPPPGMAPMSMGVPPRPPAGAMGMPPPRGF